MGAVVVVVVAPGGDEFAGMAEAREEVFVQAFVAEAAVEALDEAVFRIDFPGAI